VKVPEEDLDELIRQAKLGEQTAKRLRAANDAGSPSRSSGHGSPEPIRGEVASL